MDFAELKSYRQNCLEEFSKATKEFPFPILMVLDSYKQQSDLSRIDFDQFEIVYTAYNQKADEYIIEAVRRAKIPKKIMVVTNDRSLSREILNLNGQTMSTQKFLSKLQKKVTAPRKEEMSQLFADSDFNYYFECFSKKSHKKEKEK